MMDGNKIKPTCKRCKAQYQNCQIDCKFSNSWPLQQLHLCSEVFFNIDIDVFTIYS